MRRLLVLWSTLACSAPTSPHVPQLRPAPAQLVVSLGDDDGWTEDEFVTRNVEGADGPYRFGASFVYALDHDEQTVEQAVKALSELIHTPLTAPKNCTALPIESVACEVIGEPAPARVAACLGRLLPDRTLGDRDGAAVRLTPDGVKHVTSSVQSKLVSRVSFELNAPVARLAAAAAVTAVADKPIDDAQATAVATACEATAEWLAGGEQQPASLLCLFRAVSGLTALPIETWGGCSCGKRGRQLGGFCFESTAVARLFYNVPIDARVPAMLVVALEHANRTLAPHGIAIESVGLTGCYFPRLERGGTTRSLAQQPIPRLSVDMVSNHAAATACDLSKIWTNKGLISVEMMYLAMLSERGQEHIDQERQLALQMRRTIGGHGEGAWFRAANATNATTQMDRSRVVGFAVRNALVDAGFIVYTPATNAAHLDHFHLALPRDHVAARELLDLSTPAARREELIAPELSRAAGSVQ